MPGDPLVKVEALRHEGRKGGTQAPRALCSFPVSVSPRRGACSMLAVRWPFKPRG